MSFLRPALVVAHAVLCIAGASTLQAQISRSSSRRIARGTFVEFYRGADGAARRVTVQPFRIDAYPVTNTRFLEFVRANPRWQRSRVPSVFADSQYLRGWEGDESLSADIGEQPVTFVSWFAARAYCDSVGGHLPTETQWEYVGRAGERSRDESSRPESVRQILAWYSQPATATLTAVGRRPPNVWGVYDLHGLIWEWVDDFNASMVGSDSRERGDRALDRFCGGASVGASDVTDYASFMRYAFRSSLRASFTIHNLGFRCVYDEEQERR